jgi:hypothetical protein
VAGEYAAPFIPTQGFAELSDDLRGRFFGQRPKGIEQTSSDGPLTHRSFVIRVIGVKEKLR